MTPEGLYLSILYQLFRHLFKIIDLSIQHCCESLAGRMHRLRACRRQIENGQSSVAQYDCSFFICPDTALVRAAMKLSIAPAYCKNLLFHTFFLSLQHHFAITQSNFLTEFQLLPGKNDSYRLHDGR